MKSLIWPINFGDFRKSFINLPKHVLTSLTNTLHCVLYMKINMCEVAHLKQDNTQLFKHVVYSYGVNLELI